MEEDVLVKEMKEGKKDAFDKLYQQYQNTAIRMAYLITGNYADSEDITQEAFVKCYLHRKELKENQSFKSWFFRILTRTAWKYCQKKGKEIPEEEIDKGEVSDNTSLDIILKQEEHERITKEIRQLSVKHRTVVVLFYYNEMSTKEIADILECMEGTVKSRLYTARKQLKKSLQLEKEEEVCYI